MKRKLPGILSALLIIIIIISLTACGSQAGLSGSDKTLKQLAEVYGMPLEYGRLYLQSSDILADPTLTADNCCYAYSHYGNELVAAFEDHTIRRFDLTNGQSEILVEDTRDDITLLQHCGDSDFLYASVSMSEGSNVYRWHDGQVQQIVEKSYDIYGLYVSDGAIVYEKYNGSEDVTYLAAMNIDDETERWRVVPEYDRFGFAYQQDGTVYMVCDDTKLCRVEMKDGALTPIDLPFDPSIYDILYMGSDGSYLLNDYGYQSGQPGVYYVKGDEMKLLDAIPVDGDYSYATALDNVGDKVLVQSLQTKVNEVLSDAENEVTYIGDVYNLVDMAADATVTPFSPRSEIVREFESGDFPVMDSSTARKPVTKDIYNLFCNNGTLSGSVPVCNTTHGAWLAIGDGTSDVALLAAPTDEEQAYLDEKGVEAEMKLYGGDGLVFIGNTACGVTDVTLEQVKAIYRGEITNWSELGGVDAPIRVLYRDDQSGSQRLFERMVWADEEIPDFEALGFEQLTEMNTIVKVCLFDPYSFGYSIMTYLNDVYDEEELQAFSLNGVTAEPAHVADSTYALSTKGYVVIRADEAQDSPARRLYNWFGSPVCNEILTANGITPIHD